MLRVGGARNPHVPADAIPLAEGALAAAALLADRTPVVWDETAADELAAIGEYLRRAGQSAPSRGQVWSAWWRAKVWRGGVDVSTRELGNVVNPGTPDRLALLLRRIAAYAEPVRRRTGSALPDDGGGRVVVHRLGTGLDVDGAGCGDQGGAG